MSLGYSICGDHRDKISTLLTPCLDVTDPWVRRTKDVDGLARRVHLGDRTTSLPSSLTPNRYKQLRLTYKTRTKTSRPVPLGPEVLHTKRRQGSSSHVNVAGGLPVCTGFPREPGRDSLDDTLTRSSEWVYLQQESTQ